jgi:hypothetical protein
VLQSTLDTLCLQRATIAEQLSAGKSGNPRHRAFVIMYKKVYK